MSIEVLANYGVLGAVLLWFMLRLEKKLEALTEAIENLAKEINKGREG